MYSFTLPKENLRSGSCWHFLSITWCPQLSSLGKPAEKLTSFWAAPFFTASSDYICSFLCLNSAPLATPSVNFQSCHESSQITVSSVLHIITSIQWMKILRSLFWVHLLNIERWKRQKTIHDWINTYFSYHGKNTWKTRKQMWRESKPHSFISKYHWKILNKHCWKCKEIKN